MPFRIAKSFTVESGHLLTKSASGCHFPHGHSRTIEVVVSSAHLDAADMVCDFATIKSAAAHTVGHYDHAFALNTADPNFGELRATYGERVIAFPGVDPTTEILAREIFRAIRASLAELAPTVRLERIRVTETATSWAEYWE